MSDDKHPKAFGLRKSYHTNGLLLLAYTVSACCCTGYCSVSAGTGVRGFYPGMQYRTLLCLRFLFISSIKNGCFEKQSIQLNSHFKYRVLTLYWYKDSSLYGQDFSF
jgi:hypothetical protein